MSEPEPPSSPPSRPSARPRTGKRRPATQRPDTTASAIGNLPEQTFFPEGEVDEEDEEEYTDEDEEADVFAFNRPITAAVPSGMQYADSTAPNTAHAPTTAGSAATGLRSEAYSIATGNMDVGGHLPELTYDVHHPPPFSGRANLNNSAFAFSIHSHQSGNTRATRPSTGQTFVSRIRKSRMGTGRTDQTGSTATDASRTSFESSREEVDGRSLDEAAPRPHARRMRSTAQLIPGTAGSGVSGVTVSTDATRSTGRGMSRGSYGMTEMTGDMTVPDGKTTWGDGMGGMIKEDSEEGSMAAVDLDMIEEDSPYPEVRASVSNMDDPEMPALTLRAWVLGMFLSVIICGLNTFFHFRTPAPYIPVLVVHFSFNPGPFNIKEHTIIVMMANVSIGPAYALYATVTSELFYKNNLGVGFSILFLLATQMTGFSFAGIARRFVVWPASMIWPSNLVVTTNLNTFHAEDDGSSGGMTRFKFFMICGSAAFAYYLLPGFLITSLSYFSWVCWIAPNNRVVNQLFGVSTGLGMGILTFDWTQVIWVGSPLTTPWWACVNIGIGFILFYWIVVPIMYYNNVWYWAFQPISVIEASDRFQSSYNVFNILTPDVQLNKTAYAEYSPVYLSASFSMTFMLAFALATALLVHTALHHGPRIYRAMKNVRTEADDIHLKLMRSYPEVPDWWFAILLAVSMVVGIVAIEVAHTDLPIWGYLISIVLPLIYTVPSAFIYAMTGSVIAINLIAELIPGYIFQGKPIPGMIFKVFTVQSISEALSFIQDMKLGHYMKIPPRSTFIAQLSACFVSCFVQVGVKELLFASVKDICGSHQAHLLTCASTKVFFTSTVIWGLVGPQRLFSPGALFQPQVWALLVGAVLPVPLYFWLRRYPRSIIRNMNLPVIFNGALSIPPASGINYASFLVVGFVFQFWVRRKAFAWWSKYNYVLSAALDVGTLLSAVFIFLFLDLPGASVNWSGNTIYQNTLDWDGIPYYDAPPEGFGPSTCKSGVSERGLELMKRNPVHPTGKV
ncbi:hypothetical protein P7C73_g6631, partial [Tremellales sp. Uapishka_1]